MIPTTEPPELSSCKTESTNFLPFVSSAVLESKPIELGDPQYAAAPAIPDEQASGLNDLLTAFEFDPFENLNQKSFRTSKAKDSMFLISRTSRKSVRMKKDFSVF